MFSRNQRVLSTDYKPEEEQRRQQTFKKNQMTIFRCFATEDGQKTLEILESMVAGNIVGENIHITNANAARRDLVDWIRISCKRGLEGLK